MDFLFAVGGYCALFGLIMLLWILGWLFWLLCYLFCWVMLVYVWFVVCDLWFGCVVGLYLDAGLIVVGGCDFLQMLF